MSGAPLLPRAAALARLKKQQQFWGDSYDGTIDDFIAAGLVLPSQVPGTPGNRKVQASYFADGRICPQGSGRGYALSIRLTSRDRAEVRIPADDEEVERRREERARQAERERLAQCAKARLDAIPRTHDAFRAQTEEFARSVLNALLASVGATDAHGFRYDNTDGERMQELCVEIVRVIADGTTVLDRARQSDALVAQRSVIANADHGFMRMLQSIAPAAAMKHATAIGHP